MGGEILELYSERMERFEREISERAMAKGMAQAQSQDIINSIILLRKVGTDDDNIINLVTSQYNIPTEEVMQYM